MSRSDRVGVGLPGRGGSHYWPVPPRVVVALLVIATLAAALFTINAVSYAYVRMGIAEGWTFVILFASILGSWINIPIVRLRGTITFEPVIVRAFGMLYVVPRTVRIGTKIIAVNAGGALIPLTLSVYLIVVNDLGWEAVVAVAVVAVITHAVARIVPGVGVVVPTLVPPAAAALTAWAIGAEAIAALAYVCGTVGTLVGADLVNLRRVRDMEGPVLSIGGAGTFDGIFVTGILAVLLTAI
jgi:uncharacterized membrane protein